MKIILFSNHRATLSVIDYLNTLGYLEAVVSTDKLGDSHLEIENFCDIKNIHFLKVNKHDLAIRVGKLFTEIQPDVAIMFGFSYRIPASIYDFPRLGFYNVHFSTLPAYKGPDPIFWQLKNGETLGGITLHLLAEKFDSGPVIMQRQIPFIPGESWGICNRRYTEILQLMLSDFIDTLSIGKGLPFLKTAANSNSYFERPSVADLTICWEYQTADQIENLVNAANPLYGGAITTMCGQSVQILEVSPVDGSAKPDVVPGTVIHADSNGLFVQCVDLKILRINIISLAEGVMTGFRLAMLGFKIGEAFGNAKANLKKHQLLIT